MTPDALLAQYGPRESMEYDVVVVGAGPGGLATAIRLKQLAAEAGRDVSVCVLEKGSEPGAHILSGAIMDPRALTELFPDWKEKGAPLKQPVTEDQFLFLSDTGAKATPHALLPECFHNQGNYIISLGALTRWLSTQAEGLGVEIFPGFAATEILYTDAGAVKGVATGNMGLGKDGEPTAEFQLGMELHAKYTIFAEGSRGQLGRQLLARFSLDAGKDPQAYGLGIKELWQIDPAKHTPGLVVHTAGWPLDADTYGGSFLYHAEEGKVAIGLVSGPGLQEPVAEPVRGVPALQDPSGDPQAPGRRQAHRLRRPFDHGRRPDVSAQAGLPRRRTGGLRGRHAQRQPHQGQPRGDQDRHAGRRGRVRGAGRRPQRR